MLQYDQTAESVVRMQVISGAIAALCILQNRSGRTLRSSILEFVITRLKTVITNCREFVETDHKTAIVVGPWS